MLYHQLAEDVSRSVDEGILGPGDRIPSIRETSRTRGLSISTVKRAYQLLESRGVVEARPQAGYFVAASKQGRDAAEGEPQEPAEAAREPIDSVRYVLSTLRRIRAEKVLPLGSPYPDPTLFAWHKFHRRLRAVTRRLETAGTSVDMPPGQPELIRQIAKRHLRHGLDVDPREIIVTVGATEGINLCLRAVAKPGDTIAVESPVFYVMLKATERLGMRVVELPTDPRTGIDIDALADLLQRQRIDACITMPNFHNPLGFAVPDAHKRALVELAARHRMPLIENGVYNELHYDDRPPTTLKAFDTSGIVLHCGSFSKSLCPDAGVGWILAGRYRAEIEQLKFLSTVSTSAIAQTAVAEFLSLDGWDRQLRGIRKALQQRAAIMSALVSRVFPAGTTLSEPRGGYLLWLQLPSGLDAASIAREATARGISITPGQIFGNSDRYRHCIRLNYSYAWTPEVEQAIKIVGAIASHKAGG